MNKKYLAVPLTLSLLLAACGNDENTKNKEEVKTEQQSKEIVLNMEQELKLKTIFSAYSFKSHEAIDAFSIGINNNAFEGLYRQEAKGIEPAVALSYDVSDDHLVYTFKLREGVKWSNGEPVTAHDFEFAWKYAVHPENQAVTSAAFGDLKNYTKINTPDDALFGNVDELGVKAIDDLTLQVTYENPKNETDTLTSLAHPYFAPQNKTLATKLGDDYGKNLENYAFNGPFKLATYVEGEKLVLEKNEQYWDKKNVKLEKITYDFVPVDQYETTSLLNAFNKDELSRVGLVENQYNDHKDNKELTIYPSAVVSYFQFNTITADFSNKHIRKAIALAIDNKKINEVAYNGANNPLDSLIPKDLIHSSTGDDFYQEPLIPYNPEEAVISFEKGLKELNKKEVPMKLGAFASSPALEQVITEMKLQIEETLPNVQVEIKLYTDINEYVTDISTGELDLFWYAISAGQNNAIDYLSAFSNTHPFNLGQFNHAKYNELITLPETLLTEEETIKKFREAEKILVQDETAIIPFVQTNAIELLQDYIHELYKPAIGSPSYKYTYLQKK